MSNCSNTRGGARPGAGRRPGSGRSAAHEDLTQLRIPRADKAAVIDLITTRRAQRGAESWRPVAEPQPLPLPLFGSSVRAGQPASADEHLESMLDLNRYLIADALATFMVRVKGESMIGAGIGEGDILVVEKGRPARHDQIVLAIIDGEFTVKRLFSRNGKLALMPENPAFAPIVPRPGQELAIWGVVTACIKKF